MKDKVVLITGSSIGIGMETAFKFAGEGSKAIITYYKDKKEASKVADKCLLMGASDVMVLELDLTKTSSIRNCVKKVVERFKKIDVLINNAGVIAWKTLKEQSHEEIEAQMRTNLEGLIKTTKECLPYVKESIINVASGVGKSGFGGLSVYCATKFGIRGFTQSLSQELPNVKVVSVNPGTTATRMTGFRGIPAERAADVILRAAKGQIKADSHNDVDAWEHV